MLGEERNLRKTKAAWLHSTGYGLDNEPAPTVQSHPSACAGTHGPLQEDAVVFKSHLFTASSDSARSAVAPESGDS